MNNVKEWTSLPKPELLTRSFRGKDWKISAESSLMPPLPTPPPPSTTQSVNGLNRTTVKVIRPIRAKLNTGITSNTLIHYSSHMSVYVG